jgi:hypothetical protein
MLISFFLKMCVVPRMTVLCRSRWRGQQGCHLTIFGVITVSFLPFAPPLPSHSTRAAFQPVDIFLCFILHYISVCLIETSINISKNNVVFVTWHGSVCCNLLVSQFGNLITLTCLNWQLIGYLFVPFVLLHLHSYLFTDIKCAHNL